MAARIGLAALLLVLAGCAPASPPQRDLAAVVKPAEIAYLMCLQQRPGDEQGCRSLQLPDPTSTLAYGMCLEYHRLDAKACSDLRVAYETELQAYLSRPDPAANAASGTSTPPINRQRARELHQTAEALYRATSTDAQTFAAALVVPDVRRKVAAVLRQNLSDEQLHTMAEQARSEALYWYSYMQGLEQAQASRY